MQDGQNEYSLKIERIRNKLSSLKIKVNSDEILSEILVIGDLISNVNHHELYFQILQSDDFVYDLHKDLFELSTKIYSNGKSPNFTTLLEVLHSEKKYNDRIFAEILEYSTPMRMVNIESFATKLKEASLKRKIRQLAKETYNQSSDIDVFTLLENHKKEVENLTNFINSNNATELHNLAEDTYEKILKIRSRTNEKHNGVHTGFRELDLMTDGFDNGDLILIAARPSMGKTAFALSITHQIAKMNIPVAFFSIEMVKEQIMTRLFSQITKIDSNKFKRGNFSSEEHSKIKDAIQYSYKLPIWIDDSASLSLVELRNRAKRLVKNNGVKAIFIDYLGIMKTTKEQNREREVSVLSQGLKQLAKELQVPVIALSQLSRNTEQRGDKKPLLSDLRDSGGLEQDADQVIFIHRPEYYKIKTFSDGLSTENIAEIIVAKNRNGPVGDIRLAFIKDYTLFSNLAPIGYEAPPESVNNQRTAAKQKQDVNWEDPYF